MITIRLNLTSAITIPSSKLLSFEEHRRLNDYVNKIRQEITSYVGKSSISIYSNSTDLSIKIDKTD